MAQGEGASLLVRAYIETSDEKYLRAAQSAVDFMCRPITNGGCAQYINGKLYLKEFIEKPIILNGWIFSIWGLYDYYKVSKDDKYKHLLDNTIKALEQAINIFDCKYWSKYDMEKTITSPFYHKLHIAQLKVMYDLFSCSIFSEYADKWEKYQQNKIYSCTAFIIKVFQKLTERTNGELEIVG